MANARPKLGKMPESIACYDTIILGYPNWCGTMPMPVWTFLEQYDFTGKTILPFCTHEGSGIEKSIRDLQQLCPGAKIKKGLAIKGQNVQSAGESIAQWLAELHLINA